MEKKIVKQRRNLEFPKTTNEVVLKVSQNDHYSNSTSSVLSNHKKTGSLSKKDIYEENLKFFIKRKILRDDKLLRYKLCPRLAVSDEQMNNLVAEYILTHFTLWELYVIFFATQDSYGWVKCDLKDAKKSAINCIDSLVELTPREAKRLKKIVWDMNLIMFGLILNFTLYYDLFYDVEKNKIFYQDFKLSK